MINHFVSRSLRLALGLIFVSSLVTVASNPAPPEHQRCYVDVDATSGGNTGASWADAYTDLQSALGFWSLCTDVWVAEGTYKPTSGTDRTVSFALRDFVGLSGGFAGGETDLSQSDPAAHPTILSGEIGEAGIADNSYHVVTAIGVGHYGELDGFTVTAGNANGSWPDNLGGGMYINSGSLSVKNVTFSGNSAQQGGGGMFNNSSSPSLVNLIFSGNQAGSYGGGMQNYSGSSPSLVNVTFSGNSATYGGGIYNSDSSPSLVNVTFSGNSAQQGGGGMYNFFNSSPSLTNVTFSGNSTTNGGGIYNDIGSNPIITNSILYGDIGGEIYNNNSSPVVSYSIVQGGYTGTGNLDADPLLGPLQDNGGFTLTRLPGAGSPAIDSGTDTGCPAADQRGIARPQDGNGDGVAVCDMGAVEVRNPVLLCYVNVNVAGGVHDGTSWANAYSGLQPALADPFCRNIWVAAGTYKPAGGTDRAASFVLKSEMSVYGGFAGTETDLSQRDPAAHLTILSGDIDNNDSQTPVINDLSTVTGNTTNSYHVVTGANGATLDGFTITAGYANDPAQPNNMGAGMYNQSVSDLALVNLVFRGNLAGGSGGAVDNHESTAAFTNVTIAGNSAVLGGGIFNWNTSSTLTNVTFSGNSAGYGGGIGSHWSTLALTNVTFSNNSANEGGGIYNDWSTPAQISNAIFWNNTAIWGAQIGNANGGSAVAVNSIVQGGYEGTGNLDADPLLGPLQNNGGFTPTMAPGLGSPAIDSGTDTDCPAADQRGIARPQDGNGDGTPTCDIGSVEMRDPALPCHVNASVAGGFHNGYSWEDAYAELQPALVDPSCRQVWVAAGTYKPAGGTDRAASFVLKSGLSVYGGFAGGETDLSQSDPAAHPTILSGEIGEAGNAADNSYHVVKSTGVDSTALLDGFTVTAGNADGSWPDNLGGGMINTSGSPSVMNVTFSGNSAQQGGGGMFNNGSSPSLVNLIFSGNQAGSYGGGMQNYSGSSPSLVNVTFSGNSTTYGGGICNSESSPSLVNVTFSGNSAQQGGGGMYNFFNSSPSLTNVTFSGNSTTNGGGIYNDIGSNPIITNSILYGDTGGEIYNNNSSPVVSYSIVQGGYTGTGNLDADPLLKPLADNGGFTPTMALGLGSPAIDKGTDIGCPAWDQRGIARPQGSRCDIGAYEYQQLLKASTGAQDGWVLEAGELSGTGGTLNAIAATLNVGDDALDRQYRAILSFNTAALPDNAVITKVVLKVRKQGLVGSNPFATHGNILVDIRKGGFSGNNALQIGDFQAAPSVATSVGTLKNPALTGGWYQTTLAAKALPYVNRTGVTQFRLRFLKDDNDDMHADFLKFYSGNAPLAYRPTLVILYYTPE